MEENQEKKDVLKENYLEAIKNLKENTVSKEEYDRVVTENKTLLEGIVNGGALPTNQKEEEDTRTVNDIRKELFADDGKSNLHFAELAIDLRKKIMAEGGEDPFLPVGKDIIIQDSDRESANRVAEALEACIKYADGDSAIFTNELQRITRDVGIPKRK